MKNTNIDMIQKIALDFLNLEIHETEYSPLIVSHPFWNTALVTHKSGKEYQYVNILENKDVFEELKAAIELQIINITKVDRLFYLIQKPYRLVFMKYVKKYMSNIDFSHILSDIWMNSENPNQDVNVSISTLIQWFQEANKNVLMTAKEFYTFSNFPNKVRIYRGVAVGRNPDGISWTDDKETAIFFSQRFDTKMKKGYLRKGYIYKKDILAYFSQENEIVIDIDHLLED